jgi:hydroxymethylpyrimidine pyrophosphatase-like HAD family hydrolase
MKTICIDIDGTLVHYEEWQGENYFGPVIPGAADAVKQLRLNGWFVIIYTTRSDKAVIKKFLIENKIEFDAINENPYQPINAIGGKPIADVYIDDRAITFDGDWTTAYDKIVSFKPWE